MCQTAIFYYTFCGCKNGYTIWDGGEPRHQTLRKDPKTRPIHKCIDGKDYSLQRVESGASGNQQCQASNSEEGQTRRPCFECFASQLEFLSAVRKGDQLKVLSFDCGKMDISCQNSAERVAMLITTSNVWKTASTVEKTADGEESKKTYDVHKKEEVDYESATEEYFSAAEQIFERKSKSKAPLTAEEKEARVECLRKGTLLANQRAADINRRNSAQRDRKDSAVSVDEQPSPQEQYGEDATEQQPITESMETIAQFPEPLLSDPLIRPVVKLPGMAKPTVPQRSLPPKTHSYTSLRYPIGPEERSTIVAEERDRPEKQRTTSGLGMLNMTRYHTVANGIRREITAFTSIQQPVERTSPSTIHNDQQMHERSRYHTINNIMRPEAASSVPDQQPKARQPSTHDTQQQLEVSRRPTNSSRLRPTASDFRPIQQQAMVATRNDAHSAARPERDPLLGRKSTRRRQRRK
jgi:hypothetical protein